MKFLSIPRLTETINVDGYLSELKQKAIEGDNSWCRILTGGVKGLNELILLIVLLDSLVMKPHKTAMNPRCTGKVNIFSETTRFYIWILNRNYFFKINSRKVVGGSWMPW